MERKKHLSTFIENLPKKYEQFKEIPYEEIFTTLDFAASAL